VKRLAALALLLPLAAAARKTPRGRPRGPRLDPTHWFAARPGLLRVYQSTARGAKDEPPAGTSCEVLESKPRDSLSAGSLKESCTMIVGRRARPATEITYQLRRDGIFSVQAGTEGPQAAAHPTPRLVLPAPIGVGSSWKEPRGSVELDRTVKSAGGACKAAGRSFADCLVLSVVQKQGKKVLRKYTETYAAGVGLVEDAHWELVDVKDL
jgi:hypothetical protein